VIARVAVFSPLPSPLDYTVPQGLAGRVRPGTRVWVPLGARSIEGVVLEVDPPDPPPTRLRALREVVEATPLGDDVLALARWIADHYLQPPGEVLRLFLPVRGGARARRTVRLTELGEAARGELAAALLSPAVAELDERARAMLLAVAGGVDEAALRETHAEIAALRELEARGLVSIEEVVRLSGTRKDTRLTIARALADGELRRAPSRLAVYQRVAEAGAVLLSALRAADGHAPAHARALVDAGLLAAAPVDLAAPRARSAEPASLPPPVLTAAQAAALATIEPALRAGGYAPFLLHGVTGSGKTEVYLRAIACALELGRTALTLVPEIALTPQLTARFTARFGDQVAVLHSGLGDRERRAAFQRLERGEVAIALGARSAVFAPVAHLGLVIVDEEHDPSFKQEDGVRYHGRDVALMRAQKAGAVAVLGSATPALETYAAAQAGRLSLLTLPERATSAPMPTVEVVDLRQHRLEKGSLISAPLERALSETLSAGCQAILFLNRRGFSTFILCKACGVAARCPNCSVTLTLHRGANRLLCHYCGHHAPPPKACPECGAASLLHLGIGTEQVETQVQARFPSARVQRLDRDTADGDGLQRILEAIRGRTVDVIVGTQMVSKGHDFPDVTLVGVLLADHGMGFPDFRASERTFQLLEQVAGRAGRADRPGHVVIQTYSPRHPAVTCAREHDYRRFVDGELEHRRELGYPPTSRLACVRFDGADPQAVRAIAERAGEAARASAGRAPSELGVSILGPAEAPLGRLKGRTRWQLFIKARAVRALKVVARAAAAVEAPRSVRVSIDVDPVSML
jgi:primosomal protein N' (replication factor Y)